MQWCFVSEIKLRYCVLFLKWSRNLVFCFGNEAAVLCFVSEMKPRYCVLFRKPAVLAVADALHRWESSLRRNFFKSGCIPPSKSIPIRKNSPPGIIFPRRMHPYSEKFVTKDYCFMENASLTSYFVESGCIPPSKCIPDRVFLQIRMHSSGK